MNSSRKRELEIIEELVKENGHLHTVVGTANQVLSKKIQDMGMNVADIINKSKHKNRLETNSQITSTVIEEQLKQINET